MADTASPDRFTGGCLCGRIRFQVAGTPLRVGVCHCMDCRKHHGAVFHASAIFPASALDVEGPTASYAGRSFCPTCGSPVVSELAKTAGVIAVKAGTLDDRSDVQPTVEVWCVDRQPWVSLPGMAVSLERESA